VKNKEFFDFFGIGRKKYLILNLCLPMVYNTKTSAKKWAKNG
jgi:hypothetical protein